MDFSRYQSSEDRLQYLSTQAIPISLTSLASKHETLCQTIQYLEGSYLVASGDAKKEAEEEARKCLVGSLHAVSKDIENLAASMDQLVDINTNAVVSLSNQVSFLRTRLRISKDLHIHGGLRDARLLLMRDTDSAARELQAHEVPAALPDFRRRTMSDRLAVLEELAASPSGRPALNRRASALGAAASPLLQRTTPGPSQLAKVP